MQLFFVNSNVMKWITPVLNTRPSISCGCIQFYQNVFHLQSGRAVSQRASAWQLLPST